MPKRHYITDIRILAARLSIELNRVNACNIQFRMPDFCVRIRLQPANDVISDPDKFIYCMIIDLHTILGGINHGKKLAAEGNIVLDSPAFRLYRQTFFVDK